MDRRKFLQGSCLAGLAALGVGSLSSVLSRSVLASEHRQADGVVEIPIMLQDAPDLTVDGGTYHLEVEDLFKDILVVRLSEGKFVAVDIKCTHKGCDVEFMPDRKEFNCPCHNSRFSLAGDVLKGPAKKDLRWYPTYLRGPELIVRIAPEAERPPVDSTVVVPSMDSTVKQSTIPVSPIESSDPFK